MTIDVFAADEQGEHPVDAERLSLLARQVLQARGVKGDAEVSLLFVDEEAIAALNERFLERRGPTDVLAFPIEDEPVVGRSPDTGGPGPGVQEATGGPLVLLGDVVVCPAVAARQAAEEGIAYDDEVALLVVHGLLHLLGMDHEDDAAAEAMEAAERQLLQRFYTSGPGGDGRLWARLPGRRWRGEPGHGGAVPRRGGGPGPPEDPTGG